MTLSFSSLSGGTSFTINTSAGGSKTATLSKSFPAGTYIIDSKGGDTNLEVYLGTSSNTSAGSCAAGAKLITASAAFLYVTTVNADVNDAVTFTLKTVAALTTKTDAFWSPPTITDITPSGLPNVDDTTTITGTNFASNVEVKFRKSDDSTLVTPKTTVRGSATSIIAGRPDSFAVGDAPYDVIVTNPSTTLSGTSLDAITSGAVPVWVTSTTLNAATIDSEFSQTIQATDADGSSTITYAIVSGAFQTGLSFNTSTGAITGTPTGSNGSTTIVISATDSGGNAVNRTFTQVINPGTITVNYLVVAGGGGAGGGHGGGGGAGGLRSTVTATGGSGSLETPLSLPLNTNYTVIVGAGGIFGNGYDAQAPNNDGRNGSNSVFSTITATGGGGGGGGDTSTTYSTGKTGGSGGGGSGHVPNSVGGAASPSGQGFAGGNGRSSSGESAGGGGGAAAVGGNASSSTVAGAGGAGRASSISGSSVTYAGGGGGGSTSGGTGGSGGSSIGGAGSSTGNIQGGFGVVNTGSGGGGGSGGAPSGGFPKGGAGGSGIVVISYAGPQAATGGIVTTSGGNTIHTFNASGNFKTSYTVAKATGGAINTDGTYFYHVFNSSGTFTPTQSIIADILVVAGGGGGGGHTGGNGNGGGGAGGLLVYTSQSLTATGYTCTVGNGGAAGQLGVNSAAGGNSQFGALTASVGGGRGASGGTSPNASGTGGSGGGGQGSNEQTFISGSTGTSGQGNPGGSGIGGYFAGGGGGGGAGGSGANGTANAGGAGGVGATSSFINTIGAATGTGQLASSNYYFAGGGGGSNSGSSGSALGGSGGGGTGFWNGIQGGAAVLNTGGGGGAGRDANGGNGGSGIIVVRYPV